MTRVVFITMCFMIKGLVTHAATFTSTKNGDWDDVTVWGIAIGANPYDNNSDGIFDAAEGHANNTFNTYHTVNFAPTAPRVFNPTIDYGIISIYSGGTATASVAVTDNNIAVAFYTGGSLNASANFDIGPMLCWQAAGNYTYNISVNGLLDVSGLYSVFDLQPTFNITAQNIKCSYYNAHFTGTMFQGRGITTNIDITSPTGTVEIDNYYDSNNSVLTINNGDLDIDDYVMNVYGDIIVNGGELLFPLRSLWPFGSEYCFEYQVYGRLEANFNSNFTFNSTTYETYIEVNNGGYLKLTGLNNTISQPLNYIYDGIRVESGGTVEFIDLNFSETGTTRDYSIAGNFIMTGGSYTNGGNSLNVSGSIKIEDGNYTQTAGSTTIDGTVSVEDGNYNLTGGSLTIGTSGNLLLKDSDKPAYAAIDKGILALGSNRTITNNGLMMIETYTVSGDGNVINNNEVLYVKALGTDTRNTQININNATIDNVPYQEPTIANPAVNYTGSYLYYCSETDDLNNVSKGGTANVLIPVTADGVSGSIGLFTSETQCTDRFYGEISSALPIELLFFDYQLNPEGVALYWSTASETNNDFFTLWKSDNGYDFNELETIAGNGTVTTKSDYSYLDENPVVGNNYYKLSQTDYDGTTTYFNILCAQFRSNVKIVVYPTSLKLGENITIQMNKTTPISVTLVNSNGQLIQTYQTDAQYSEFNFSNVKSSGIYYLVVEYDNEIFKQIVHLQ